MSGSADSVVVISVDDFKSFMTEQIAQLEVRTKSFMTEQVAHLEVRTKSFMTEQVAQLEVRTKSVITEQLNEHLAQHEVRTKLFIDKQLKEHLAQHEVRMEERLDQRLDQRLAQHEVRTKLFIDEQLAQKFSEQDSKFARWMTTIQNDLLYLSKSVHQINSRMTRSETRFENDIIKKRKNAARIVDPGTTLLPLYSIHTGTAIPNFPQTCKALCQMDVDALKPILRALELRVDGDLEDLRDRLHLAIM